MAMSKLVDFLGEYTNGSSIEVFGDKSANTDNNYLIVIGSEANNDFSRDIFRRLREHFVLPYDIRYEKQTGKVWIQPSEDKGQPFHPNIR